MSPDGPKSPSPEEKLLRLIKSKGKLSGSEALSASHAGEAAPSLKSGSKFPLGFKLPFNFSSKWLLSLNILLGVIAVIGVVSIIFVLVKPLPRNNNDQDVLSAKKEDSNLSKAEQILEEHKDVPSIAGTSSRPLFQAQTNSATSSGFATRMSTQAKDLSSKLNLLGVVDGNPTQAIIEDSQTSKTYFLSVGQAIPDGAIVEEILKNRVKLDFNGEKIELSL
jgi:hypothetical protein